MTFCGCDSVKAKWRLFRLCSILFALRRAARAAPCYPPDAGAGWSGGFQCSDPIDAFFWLFLGLQDFGERKGLL